MVADRVKKHWLKLHGVIFLDNCEQMAALF